MSLTLPLKEMHSWLNLENYAHITLISMINYFFYTKILILYFWNHDNKIYLKQWTSPIRVSSKLDPYVGRITKLPKAPEQLSLAHTVEDNSKAHSKTMQFFFVGAKSQVSVFFAPRGKDESPPIQDLAQW